MSEKILRFLLNLATPVRGLVWGLDELLPYISFWSSTFGICCRALGVEGCCAKCPISRCLVLKGDATSRGQAPVWTCSLDKNRRRPGATKSKGKIRHTHIRTQAHKREYKHARPTQRYHHCQKMSRNANSGERERMGTAQKCLVFILQEKKTREQKTESG